MWNKTDSIIDGKGMRGFVTGRWVNTSTGESRSAFGRRNQLSYAAADMLAQLVAGNADAVPRHMGFVYGDAYASPAGLTDPTLRTQTWAGLGTELADVHGNIQIAPVTLTPTLVVDGDAALYAANSVVLTAHTVAAASGTYGFPLTAPYAGLLDTGAYLYHAVLLTRKTVAGGIVYTPVARVTLGEAGPVYLTKPDGFELALDWQISFF